MTQKRRSLVKLRDARSRLRDMEAARTAQAAAHCDAQEHVLAVANRDLVSAVQRACDELARARQVSDVENAHLHVGAARDFVTDAAQSVMAATESRRAAASILNQRERELRGTERALEVVTSAERREVERREQVMVDDLVGARMARRDV
jgi:hypothetical protein